MQEANSPTTCAVLRHGLINNEEAENIVEYLSSLDVRAKVIDPESLLNIEDGTLEVIYTSPFEGELFEKLKQTNARIYGPSMFPNEGVWPTRHVQFSDAMSHVVAYCGEVDEDIKGEITQMIEYMGGRITDNLLFGVTHIVSNKVTPAIKEYRSKGIPTALPAWVKESWCRHFSHNDTGSVEAALHKHRLPILAGCRIFISPTEFSERFYTRLSGVALGLGASVLNSIDDTCTHLATQIIKGEQVEKAIAQGAIPVTMAWLLDCQSQRQWTDESEFEVLAINNSISELGTETPNSYHSPKRQRMSNCFSPAPTADQPSALNTPQAALTPRTLHPVSNVATPMSDGRRRTGSVDLSVISPKVGPAVMTRSSSLRKMREAAQQNTPTPPLVAPTKRKFRVDELLEREQSYFNNLDIIITLFKKPMEANNIHKDQTRDSLFGNIESLRQLSGSIVTELKERMVTYTDEATLISDVYSEKSELFKKLYRSYVVGQQHTKSLLDQKMKTSSFANFVKQCESDRKCRRLTLSAFLMMPVQHIGRYSLLIKEILHSTGEEHPDYEGLTHILTEFNNIMSYVDDQTMQYSRFEELHDLLKTIDGGMSFCSYGRYVVKRVEARLRTSDGASKRVMLLLLNDCLIVSLKTKSRKKAKPGTLCYKAYTQAKLATIDAFDMMDGSSGEQRSFVMTMPLCEGGSDVSMVFQVASTECKADWLKTVRDVYHKATGDLTERMKADEDDFIVNERAKQITKMKGSSASINSTSSMLSVNSVASMNSIGSMSSMNSMTSMGSMASLNSMASVGSSGSVLRNSTSTASLASCIDQEDDSSFDDSTSLCSLSMNRTPLSLSLRSRPSSMMESSSVNGTPVNGASKAFVFQAPRESGVQARPKNKLRLSIKRNGSSKNRSRPVSLAVTDSSLPPELSALGNDVKRSSSLKSQGMDEASPRGRSGSFSTRFQFKKKFKNVSDLVLRRNSKADSLKENIDDENMLQRSRSFQQGRKRKEDDFDTSACGEHCNQSSSNTPGFKAMSLGQRFAQK